MEAAGRGRVEILGGGTLEVSGAGALGLQGPIMCDKNAFDGCLIANTLCASSIFVAPISGGHVILRI